LIEHKTIRNVNIYNEHVHLVTLCVPEVNISVMKLKVLLPTSIKVV